MTHVELADDGTGPVVRVNLRNLSDEAVTGLEFEIRGGSRSSWGGYGELSQMQTDEPQFVIAPRGKHVVDIPLDTFGPGDKLRLAAVLFASGRGEGDVELVDEMRRESASSHPPAPSEPEPETAPN